MKNKIIPFLLLLIVTSSKSQNIEDFKMSNGLINDAKLIEYTNEKRYPGYNYYMDNWYQNLTQQINNIQNHKTGIRSQLQIPVVVHIVYKDSIENIPQSIIDTQIAVLNRDFQRKNADTSKLRNAFHTITGNPNIEFLLRHVERVNTTSNFMMDPISLHDDIKHSTTGGSDAWPTSHYLNIWVGNLQPGFLAGYAYPPVGAPGWPSGSSAPSPDDDGIVIDYRFFNLSNNYPLQERLIVHEVGHYLGLRHIWGDAPCSADDGLNDTPNAFSESNFDCDTTKNTCNDGIGDLPDMVENFMDYSADTCMVTFTADQASLMRTVLQTYRPNLISTASINGEYKDITVSLFPNPSNGIVNYDVNISESNNFDITILDPSGKALYIEESTPINGSIDLNILTSGVYFFRISSMDFVVSERIFIQ